MDSTAGPPSEVAELRQRLTRLSQACLRINESLDVDTALQAVMDGARSLAGAPYSAITTLDASGRVDDHLALGLDPGLLEQLWQAPGGLELFEYLNALPGPLRVGRLEDFACSIGLAELRLPVSLTAFIAAPIVHQGVRAGHIFVGHDDPGREFSREDEETLVLFASQAAQVIVNARRHREEQRARADLETLVDTSPVGVVVFDAATGAPASLNREARRIVDGLRSPGQTPEMLLGVVTCRRADGHEVSLAELSLPELLSSGETISAEEIVLAVPDGRSVTVLLNATPLRSAAGTVESTVVTLQDMAPLRELERRRAEFLAVVSHELRAPLTSIKGSAATVLGSAADLDPAVVRQFLRIIEGQADHMHDLVSDLLDVARIETSTLPVSPEPAELAVMADGARSAFTSGGGKQSLAIDIAPDLPRVLADRRRIVQVLVNLLSNAARHSPESSVIRVGAERDGVRVAISVADEGRGIPAEHLPLLFGKFSAARSEDQGGDTGLGLAICKGIVEAHGGRIWAESDGPGLGARFTFTLPVAAATADARTAGSPPASSRSAQRATGQSGEPVRVLVVDDDPQALRYAHDVLSRAEFSPIVTGDPEEATRLVEEEQPHVVLMDLMLPGTDGIELMQEILQVADVPVIFVSAYGREESVARALDSGAVDYVVKPFSPTELEARIRTALRQRAASGPPEPYVYGALTVDHAERRVTLGDRPVPLVAMEYRMLAELSANAGRVLTYDQLLERVWGEKSTGDLRPMRTIVSKLRRKLGEDRDNPVYIFTEPRVGYRMPRAETAGIDPPSSP